MPLTFSHYKPSQFDALIERLTIIRTADSDYHTLFIPTPYIILFIPLNNSGYYYNNTYYTKPTLINIILSPTDFCIPENSRVLIIRFYPFGVHPFKDPDLAKGHPCELIKTLSDHKSSYLNNASDETVIEHVLDVLKPYYSQKREEQTALLKSFFYYLVNTKENTSIADFCEQRKVSYMTVYRSFQKILRIPPKKFERLVKLGISIDYLFQTNNRFTNVGLDSGYYDQAHFVKEFRHFVGKTPSEYIKYLSEKNFYTNDGYTSFSSLQ